MSLQNIPAERGITYMQNELTQGNLLKSIIRFSLPYLLSYFLQTLYGLADLFIVGQYNGAAITSAVSIGSQVMHMITVIIVGLAMGSTVMIGRFVGAGDTKKASKATGNTITIFLILSVFFTAILLCFCGGVVSVMSTPVEAVEQTRRYLLICFAGIPLITAYNIISAVFRGMGDSKSPMYFIAVACFINIILDFLLIGCFGMQAVGAALGTVLSQTFSVLFALIFIKLRGTGIAVKKQDFVIDRAVMADIFKVGVPVSLQDGFIQVSFIVITVIANRRGVDVAAAVGIVEKIIGVLFLVPSTMLSAVSTIAAQNIGAGQDKRARQALKYGIVITVSFGVFFVLLCQAVPMSLVGLFSGEQAVILWGSQYLRAYSIDCVLAGIHFCFSGYFCACRLSILSFLHNVLSILLVRIPGAWLASQIFPHTLFPMGMAAPFGSLLSALICAGAYLWIQKSVQ